MYKEGNKSNWLIWFLSVMLWGASLVVFLHPFQDIFNTYRQTPLDALGQLGMSVNLLLVLVCQLPLVVSLVLLIIITQSFLLRVMHILSVTVFLFLIALTYPLPQHFQAFYIAYIGLGIFVWLIASIMSLMDGTYGVRMAKALLYVLSIIVITTLVLEVTLRFTGKFASYEERNGHTINIAQTSPSNKDFTYRDIITKANSEFIVSEFKQTFTLNSDRIYEVEIQGKDTNEYRILVFGDSFTQGIGAVQPITNVSINTPPEYSWPLLLEQLLNKALTASNTPVKVKVINAGITGSDVVFEWKLAQELVPKYHPDMVVVALNRSENTDITLRGGIGRFNGTALQYRPITFSSELYEKAHLYRFYLHQILGYDLTTFLSPMQKRMVAEQVVATITKTLYDFEALATEHKAKFMVVFHPTVHEIRANHLVLSEVMELVEDSIQTVNLLQDFTYAGINTSNCDSLFWPIDYHHNAKGYMLFAETLFPHVMNVVATDVNGSSVQK